MTESGMHDSELRKNIGDFHTSHGSWRFILPLAIWIVLIVVSAWFAPRLSGAMRDDAPRVPGSESDVIQKLVNQEFSRPNTQDLIVVFTSSTERVTDATYMHAAGVILGQMRHVAGVKKTTAYWDNHEPSMLGKDGHSTFALLEVQGSRMDLRQRLVPALRKVAAQGPHSIRVHITGDIAIAKDLAEAGQRTVKEAERIVIPVVLVVLLLVFRSLVAALIPLGLGLVSVTIARAVMYAYALYHPVHSLASTMISMIGMGVGVDYALFMVTRFREELASGVGRHEALHRTRLTSGQAIRFSGLTVLVSVASLYIVNNPIVRVMALAMATVVLVAVLVATTLLPAVLNVIGTKIDALSLPLPRLRRAVKAGKMENEGDSEGFWHSWAMGVMRRPWLYTILAAIPLVMISYPALNVHTGWPNLSQLPEYADARRGYAILQEQFAAGLVSRIDVVAEVEGTVADPDNLTSLYNLVEEINKDPLVDSVLSFVSFRPGWGLQQYKELYLGGPEKLATTPTELATGAGQLYEAVGALTQIKVGMKAATAQLPTLGKSAQSAGQVAAQMVTGLQQMRDTLTQISQGLTLGIQDIKALSTGLTSLNGFLTRSAQELDALPTATKLNVHYVAAYSSLKAAQGIVNGNLTGQNLPEATQAGAGSLENAVGALDHVNLKMADVQAGINRMIGGLQAGSLGPVEATSSLNRVSTGLNQVIVGLRQAAGKLQEIGSTAAAAHLPVAFNGSGFGLRLAMAAGGQQAADMLPTLVNINHGATFARLIVIPKAGPDAPATANLINRLRKEILPGAGIGLRSVMVGGVPAQIVDFNQQLRWALPRIMLLVLGITFIVLLLLLRSVVLPLKAILMNTLSVTAAYGVLVLVFQQGHLAKLLGFTPLGYVESPVMVVLFAVLFGLSMDYEVFLLNRVKEIYTETKDNTRSVAEGLERTAGVITGAAVIMVFVFGAFVATGLITAKEFGFGLAVAVFLDATLIRILMVPAFMRLAGKWNWWAPKWLLQVLPKVNLHE